MQYRLIVEGRKLVESNVDILTKKQVSLKKNFSYRLFYHFVQMQVMVGMKLKVWSIKYNFLKLNILFQVQQEDIHLS